MAAVLSPATTRFRADYRAHVVPARYHGGLHLLLTFGGGLAALLACLAQLDAMRAGEWLTLPLALLYANLAEYFGHRFPMHHPYRPTRPIYRRHAGQHHRFFTDTEMALEESRDLRAVLFPPLLVVFFFGTFGIPAWLLLAWLFSANVAWLFCAAAIGYFLNYEVLHLAYHVPEGHWLGRVPGVRRLRWLHQTHHDTRLMAHVNFNISYPIGDLLFGTLCKEGASQRAAGADLRSRSADTHD